MENNEENRAALLMGLDMLTNISYVDEVGRMCNCPWCRQPPCAADRHRCRCCLVLRPSAGAASSASCSTRAAVQAGSLFPVRRASWSKPSLTHSTQVEVFKTSLDYWSLFIADIYSGASIPTTPGGGNHVRTYFACS